MKGILKKTLNSFSSNIPLDYLVKFSNKKLILPFYHTVSDTYLPHVSPLYAVRTTQQFRKDLDYICKYFRPITLQELTEIVRYNKEITEPAFHLTFDDGLHEIYSVIAPVLEEKNIPATIFLNTDFIDNKDLF